MTDFISKVRGLASKRIDNLKRAHDEREVLAVNRARLALNRARTRSEQELIKQQLTQEKYRLRKELAEAKVATQQAATAAIKAEKEARDLRGPSGLSLLKSATVKTGKDISRLLWPEPKPKRRTAKKKTATMKATTGSPKKKVVR